MKIPPTIEDPSVYKGGVAIGMITPDKIIELTIFFIMSVYFIYSFGWLMIHFYKSKNKEGKRKTREKRTFSLYLGKSFFL